MFGTVLFDFSNSATHPQPFGDVLVKRVRPPKPPQALSSGHRADYFVWRQFCSGQLLPFAIEAALLILLFTFAGRRHSFYHVCFNQANINGGSET
jgi:hypothetical protein